MKVRVESGFGGLYFTLSEYYLRPSNLEGGAFRWMLDSNRDWRIQYTNNGPYLKGGGPHQHLTVGKIRAKAESERLLDL